MYYIKKLSFEMSFEISFNFGGQFHKFYRRQMDYNLLSCALQNSFRDKILATTPSFARLSFIFSYHFSLIKVHYICLPASFFSKVAMSHTKPL